MASEMMMKKLGLLCADDFIDLDKNIIQNIFTNHFQELLEDPEIIQKPLRSCVFSNVERMVKCRTPEAGFSLFECPHCHDFKIVPHSCKSKFCNSCGVKYAAQRADTIKSIVLDCPHRHVVLTIAEKLRQFFQYDRKLLNLLFSAAADTLNHIFDSFGKKDDHFKPAFIIILHTFGRDLKWNPHVHILLADGYVDEANVFHRLKFISYTALRKRWMTTLLYALRDNIGDKYKLMLKKITNILYKKYDNGFYVYAPPTKYKNVDDTVDYVVRYVGRPVMAQSRITDYDLVNKTVSYWYGRHEDGVRVDICESVIDFMKKLILHVPDDQFKMIRYYGVYASVKKKARALVKVMTQRLFRASLFKKNWRDFLIHTFHHDPLLCKCGHNMEFLECYVL